MPVVILAVVMEMIIDFFCDRLANSLDFFEIDQPSLGNTDSGAEMIEQRALAPAADPGDLLQRRTPDRSRAPSPVAADGEPMRYITQPL